MAHVRTGVADPRLPYDVAGGVMERRQLLRGGAAGAAWLTAQALVGTGCSSQDERVARQQPTVPEPAELLRTNWSQDQWARGSYSYLPVGASPTLRANLGRPVGDRLFFAGEATNTDDPGTVHGARASGLRVAQQVAAAAQTGDQVLVVGAGMAGLTAAVELTVGRFADCNFVVNVVEARDRIGGRLHSVKPDGLDTYAERGASWIHAIDSPNSRALKRLLDDAGIETVPFDYRQAGLSPASERLPGNFLDGTEEVVDRALAWARRQGTDQSLADAVERSGAAASIDPAALEHFLTTEVTDEYGASAKLLSALEALDEGHEGPDLLVTGGYSNVAQYLADQAPELEIRLKVPIAEVNHGPDGVTVTAQDDEQFSVDRLIVTVPVGVLQAGDITFSPELPASHLGAIDGLGMGLLDKVILYFDEPFWQETASMWTRVAPGQPFREWFNPSPSVPDTQLMALSGGNLALDWAAKSDDEVRRAALAALNDFSEAGW